MIPEELPEDVDMIIKSPSGHVLFITNSKCIDTAGYIMNKRSLKAIREWMRLQRGIHKA